MSATSERYAIRLSTGQWFHGRDEQGQPKWTRVPSWAYVLSDPVELAEILEWLESSDHEYELLRDPKAGTRG
jgi:hypothetical protein